MTSNRGVSKGFAKDFLESIRAWKSRRDADTRPLVDGALEAGPFDDPSLTVAGAAKFTEGWKTLQLLHTFTLLYRPRTILELGSNVGFSAAYLAAGQKAAGVHGTVHTIDASPYRERLAREVHEDLGLDNIRRYVGLFDDVLPGVLAALDTIDLTFIDGHHEYEPTLRYFQLIAPKCPEGSVIFFDDIASYSGDMRRAWAEIQADERVYAFSEIGEIGIVVLGGAR